MNRLRFLLALAAAGFIDAWSWLENAVAEVKDTLASALGHLRAAKRIAGPGPSYAKDNPAEYAAVIAYLDGGARPNPVTEMGKGLVEAEDARRQASGVVAPPPVGEPGPIAGEGYTLVFEDNFDTFDTSSWIRAAWSGYQTTPAVDAAVSNGTLKISSRRTDGYPNRNVSTRLGAVGSPTTGKTWKRGYFECRSKWPAGKGSWPAFWLFSEHWVATSSVPPYISEIDILEAAGGLYLDKYNHVLHKNTSGAGGVADVFAPTGAAQFASPNIGDLTTAFHRYGCKWTDTTVSFYCDDIFLASCPIFANSTDQEMFMILSMWVGKADSWVGAYDATTPDVLTHEIDRVRVWQK